MKKLRILTFGRDIPITPLILDQPIKFASKWTYLGMTVIAGHIDLMSISSGFHESTDSNCIPCITYAAEVKDIPNREI